MHREPLDESANYHDAGAEEDGPSAAQPVVNDGNQRKREDGPEGISSGNHPLQRARWMVEVYISRAPVSLRLPAKYR